MFVKQLTEEVENPPPRSRWKTRQVGVFSCDRCNKKFEIRKNIKRVRLRKLHFCSKECNTLARRKGGRIFEKSSLTTLTNCGVSHFSQRPDVRKKREKTFVERYGVANASTLNWVKEKKKQTSLKNYGVSHPLLNKQVQQKKETDLLRKIWLRTCHPISFNQKQSWTNLHAKIWREELCLIKWFCTTIW